MQWSEVQERLRAGEEQLVPGSTVDHVDAAAFATFLRRQGIDLIAAPQPDLLADLTNRMVAQMADDEVRLTLYGALCFGKQPQRYAATQNAWVELVAYAGIDRADDIILKGEAKGRVDEQVERALGWLRALGIKETYDGVVRRDQMLVPERAVREAIVNAIAHRDYAVVGSKILVEVFTDRVDISSPGLLPNHMTEAAVLAGANPRSRNQLVVHFLLIAGLMEQRGRGFPIMRREMHAFNGTAPHLLNAREGGFVRLTLQR